MPTRDEVSAAVVSAIAGFTRLASDQVTLDRALQKPPLALDSNALTLLATTLRGYVKYHSQGSETVKASEVRAGLTVQGLVDLVFGKVKSDA